MGSLQDAINSNLDKSDDELAIVGLDFILPQARTLKELDQLFSKGVDCVAYPSKKRRKLMEPFFEQGKEYTYIPGAYIDDIDQFTSCAKAWIHIKDCSCNLDGMH